MDQITTKSLDFYEGIQQEKIAKYRENKAYVMGKNPGIYRENVKRSPDYRIPIPLAKSAVEDLTGFSGISKVNYEANRNETPAEEESRKEYEEINRLIYASNEAKVETTELYEQSLTQGEAYELFWISDKVEGTVLTPEFALVDNTEIVLIWEDNLKPELYAAIRFYKSHNMKYAEVYYALKMEAFKKDISKGNKKDSWVINSDCDKTYPYTRVPLSVYKSNRNSQPLFEAEKQVIDAHDNLISKSVNEIDRFNALIALFPNKVDEAFVEKLKENKIIDELGDYEKWPEYLEKTLSNIDGFYNNLADRLERLYHKTIKVPDFSDKNFAGNSSGVALEYKLMGLEFKASQVDAYFNKGLLCRQSLINDVINAGSKTYEIYEIKVENKRNLPIDRAALVEIASKLMGIVSRETLLKWLPNDIVDSAELEMQRIAKENGGIDLDNIPTDSTSTVETTSVEGEGAQVDEPGAGVQLNGAQVTAATSIIKDVLGGAIPKITGENLLKILFNFTESQVQEAFEGVIPGSVKEG